MMKQDDCFDPEVQALLERGREIRPVPDIVRARALARARASVATAGPMPVEAQPVVRRRGLVLALAASLALVVIAVSAGAALLVRRPTIEMGGERVGAPTLPLPNPPAMVRAEQSSAAPSLETQSPPTDAPKPTAPAKRPGRASPSQEFHAELELLQRVQDAYARGSFAGALALIAEHGRRFPQGRLVEEREVLRVRALAGAGRMEEARRAAAEFADRFPRSVVLPRLRRDLN